MFFKSSLKQILRTPIRATVLCVTTLLVSALLCLSMNLYMISVRNINAIKNNSLTTLASLETWGQSNNQGTLLQQLPPELVAEVMGKWIFGNDYVTKSQETDFVEKMVKRYLSGVYQLSLPPQYQPSSYSPLSVSLNKEDQVSLEHLTGVKALHLSNRFGAFYTPKSLKTNPSIAVGSICTDDVVVFRYKGTVSCDLSKSAYTLLNLDVLENFNSRYSYANRLLLRVSSPTPLTLEPGKTYIMQLADVSETAASFIGADGVTYTTPHVNGVRYAVLRETSYTLPTNYFYTTSNGQLTQTYQEPISSQQVLFAYDEAFWNSEIGMLFSAVCDAISVTGNSLTAITTNDLMTMRQFRSEVVYISEGRSFSASEYTQGAAVCLVSSIAAERNGWKIGDTLELQFYNCPQQYYQEANALPRGVQWLTSTYTDSAQFFDHGTFTIVGFFDGAVEDSSLREYANDAHLHSLHVIIPSAAVKNQPTATVSRYWSTIEINSAELNKFLFDLSASELLAARPLSYDNTVLLKQYLKDPTSNNTTGDSIMASTPVYNLRLTVYDEAGLAEVVTGLDQLQQGSRLLLFLSFLSTSMAVLMISLSLIGRIRRDIAGYYALGVRPWQMLRLSLYGILSLCTVSALLGSVMGYDITQTVAMKILEQITLSGDRVDFSAVVTDALSYNDYQLQLSVQPISILISSGMLFLLLMLILSYLVLRTIKKSPLELFRKRV